MSNSQVITNTTNFYIPISNHDFNDIYHSIRNHKIPVSYKIHDQHFKSIFLPSDTDKIYISKSFTTKHIHQQIACCFEYNGVIYLFRSFITDDEINYVVDRPTEICKMQRRDNFRINIPTTIKYNFKISTDISLKCTLQDISLSGCKISVSTASPLDYKIKDELNCIMTLLDSDQLAFKTEIAFAEFINEAKTQIYGLKFLDLNSEDASTLQSTMVRVDRIIRGKNLD